MTQEYPNEEALRLMAEAAERVSPDTEGRNRAAHKVLEALCALDGQHGFSITKEEGGTEGVIIKLPRAQYSSDKFSKVVYGNGKFTVYLEGDMRPVLLEYDRATGSYLGAEIEPLPDGTKRRREVLATIIATALGSLRPPSDEE